MPLAKKKYIPEWELTMQGNDTIPQGSLLEAQICNHSSQQSDTGASCCVVSTLSTVDYLRMPKLFNYAICCWKRDQELQYTVCRMMGLCQIVFGLTNMNKYCWNVYWNDWMNVYWNEYVKTAIWIWQNKHSIIAKWHLHWASYTKVFGTQTRRCSISSLVLNKSARLPNKYWNDIFKRMVWSGSWHLRFLLCRHTVKTNIICILSVGILMGKGLQWTKRVVPLQLHTTNIQHGRVISAHRPVISQSDTGKPSHSRHTSVNRLN